jgi:hypothetical protein
MNQAARARRINREKAFARLGGAGRDDQARAGQLQPAEQVAEGLSVGIERLAAAAGKGNRGLLRGAVLVFSLLG